MIQFKGKYDSITTLSLTFTRVWVSTMFAVAEVPGPKRGGHASPRSPRGWQDHLNGRTRRLRNNKQKIKS